MADHNCAASRNVSSRILEKVCRDRQIDVKPLCNGRVLALSRQGVSRHVYGWDFGVNTATALLVCRNKAVCSAVLTDGGIPNVHHEVFYRPDRESFGFPYDSSWAKMLHFLKLCPEGLVCKPNDLSRGVSVHRVRSESGLEKAAYDVFRFSRELTLSPFVSIDAEYRVVMLHGHCHLMYAKRLPSVTGDGVSTIGELIALGHQHAERGRSFLAMLNDVESNHELSEVPTPGTIVKIGWQHNLAHGARAELLDPTATEMGSIVQLAKRAIGVLGASFAAVDVAATDGQYRVLEVNTGIVATKLLEQTPSVGPLVSRLYGAVMDHLFRLEG